MPKVCISKTIHNLFVLINNFFGIYCLSRQQNSEYKTIIVNLLHEIITIVVDRE